MGVGEEGGHVSVRFTFVTPQKRASVTRKNDKSIEIKMKHLDDERKKEWNDRALREHTLPPLLNALK